MLKSPWGKCLLVPTDKPSLLSPSNTHFWNVSSSPPLHGAERQRSWLSLGGRSAHFKTHSRPPSGADFQRRQGGNAVVAGGGEPPRVGHLRGVAPFNQVLHTKKLWRRIN